jgi:calmodulin
MSVSPEKEETQEEEDARRIHEERVNGLREIFSLVDEDGSGSISPEELWDLVQMLQMKMSRAEMDLMVEEIDEDGNGEIDFDEFCSVLNRESSVQYTQDDIERAFAKFTVAEVLPPGHISVAGLRRSLKLYGEDIEHDEIEDLINGIVEDPSQKTINYMQWVRQIERKGK